MTSSASAVVLGSQTPRLWTAPASLLSRGADAVEAAAIAGLILDPWQQFVLHHSLGLKPDGSWQTPTVGLVCPRQNGKNGTLAALELAALYLWDEQTIIHSAHEQATASEHFRFMESLIRDTPEFSSRLLRSIHGKGSEAIELVTGQRIFFKTRTGGGGRGFTIDRIVFDEAYELPAAAISALVPAKSARPNTQTWFTSSAVDQEKHQNGVELARIRERGIEGRAGLAYFEWSCEGDDPSAVPIEVSTDPEQWAIANPGLGIRILSTTVAHEQEVELNARNFAVERLGIGDWPVTDEAAEKVIPPSAWSACEDTASQYLDAPVCLAFDVKPDQSAAAIALCGRTEDGYPHAEVIEHRPGTAWLGDCLYDLKHSRQPGAIVCDPRGPAGALIPDLKDAGIVPPEDRTRAEMGMLVAVSMNEHAHGCAMLLNDVTEHRLRHLGQVPLNRAVDGVIKRQAGDVWLWDRRQGFDISPLVAVTLARWGLATLPLTVTPRVISLAAALAGTTP